MVPKPADIFDPALYDEVRKPLLEAQTLPTWCYVDPAFYRREVETVFMKVWNFVGRIEQVPAPGDYFTLDFVGIPLLVVRGKDEQIRAFANSCRHRGAKIAEGAGNCRAFKCPYHGWVYSTEGSLAAVPGMKEAHAFDAEDYPLISVRLDTWGGFMFVNFAANPEPLASYLGDLPQVFSSYHLDEMVLTKRKSYQVACNWKIYVENAMEAYHVPHVHRASISRQKGSVKNDRTFDRTDGDWVVMHTEHHGSRAVLLGDAAFPPIDGLQGKAARGTFYPLLLPSTMLGCTVDCMWYLEIHPMGPERMELIVGSCFPKDRLQLPDFESVAANYYKRWDMTTAEDLKISELQQAGVASPLARPGRLSAHEPLIHAIDNWVLDRVLGEQRWSQELSLYAQTNLQDLDVLEHTA